MKTVRIALISGYRGAGKDTLGKMLIDKHGFVKFSFADPLRELGSLLFGISESQFQDRVEKEKPLKIYPYISPRDVLIKVGTDALRDHFDGDIWVRVAARRIADKVKKSKKNSETRIVVPDVRFLNEENFGKALSKELAERGIDAKVYSLHIGVVREKFGFWRRMKMKFFGHKSDSTFLKMKPDIFIDNTGDMSNLEEFSDIVLSNSLPWICS